MGFNSGFKGLNPCFYIRDWRSG